jgi:ferredoxin
MSRPLVVVKMIRKGFPLKDVGARLTRLPLLGRFLEKALFDGDDIVFMPRRLVLNEEIPSGDGEVVPRAIIERFIREAGFLWVMNTCICRESMKCGEYPVDLGCLFMGEAARNINPRLGREVTASEALRHLDRCREAGLFHLLGRNKVDSVWLKARPGEKLLTVCNCCTCCCLWTMLPRLSGSIASRVGRMPGVLVSVTDRCVACGTCLGAGCMAGAIRLEGRAVIDEDLCIGCGRCAEVCPEGAIEVTFEGEAAVAGTFERLSGKVDVK